MTVNEITEGRKKELERRKKRLRSYRGHKYESESIATKIRILSTEVYSIESKQIRGMPTSPYTKQDASKVIIELVDLKRKYTKKYEESMMECAEVENAITTLDDPFQRAIMRNYYINGMNWYDVAEKMNCSRTYAIQQHDEALEKIKVVH